MKNEKIERMHEFSKNAYSERVMNVECIFSMFEPMFSIIKAYVCSCKVCVN